MNKEVLFSVIIPTYNRGNYLKDAIFSVINQEYENWELLIIDDGSTDNTCQIVTQFKDPKIKYFYKQNEERSIARNFGIQKAQGEYICFLDSDDIFFSNHLSSLKNAIIEENSPIGLFQSGVLVESDQTKKILDWYKGFNREEIIKKILQGKSLYIQGICVSREILNFHQFPSKFSYWEDQHLWLRILCEYPFYVVNEITAKWQINKESSVKLFYNQDLVQNLKKYLDCINDLEKKPLIKKCNWVRKEDLISLKINKASGIINHNFKFNRSSLKQYFICLKHLGLRATFKLFIPLFLNKIR